MVQEFIKNKIDVVVSIPDRIPERVLCIWSSIAEHRK